jgi:2-polyprenyl-3-methyl-5-hydroxy-6-metoxy-1,4-benzoquinol methylase
VAREVRIVNRDGYFDERVAAAYDSLEGREESASQDIEATVEFLAGLAGSGPALEFGIGTGRVGLPLAQRGVPTQGIDLSRAMVARLKAKPGGEGVPVTIRRLRHDAGRRLVPVRLPDLQHDHEPDDEGGAGGVLP